MYPLLKLSAAFIITAVLLSGCSETPTPKVIADQQAQTTSESLRIVSLNGTLTEIICAFEMCENIVGVDVTSIYPPAVNQLPKVGHYRTLSAEGILSLGPNVVVGFEKEMRPEVKEQLSAAGVEMHLFDREFSIESAKQLISEVAQVLNVNDLSPALHSRIDADLATVKYPESKPKALFIYARGAGTLSVAGEETAVHEIIQLAGAENAVSGFTWYKPLTSEALISANPDVIVMFKHGLESLGGLDGLLEIPGVAQTKAGKNKRVIEMDGLLLAGFSPRVGQAVVELANKLDGEG